MSFALISKRCPSPLTTIDPSETCSPLVSVCPHCLEAAACNQTVRDRIHSIHLSGKKWLDHV